MFWFLGAWLVLEAGELCLGTWLFHIPVQRLVGPYIALAVAPATVGPYFYILHNKPARHRPSEAPRSQFGHRGYRVHRVDSYSAVLLRREAQLGVGEFCHG
jgi:hypothetical protein